MDFLAIYFVIMNMIALAAMGIDKSRAVRHRWRIPERVLFLLALLGGSVGSLMGMWLFWHKVRNKMFVIGMPVILLLHMLLIFLIIL